MNESQISPRDCQPRLQNLLAQSTRRKKQGWARPNSGRDAASKPERKKTASPVVAPEISERPARRGSAMPAAGRGRRHLSPGGPATTVVPGPGPRGVWGGAATARAPGPEEARIPLRPEPCAERRGRGPSRGAALPAPSAQRLRPAGPVASGRVPKRRARGARSGAAEAPPPPQGRRSRPPRGGPALRVLTGPPRPPARSSSPSSPPPPLPRLLGRPHWALGLGWVKGQGRGRTRAGRESRGGPASGRRALTGPASGRRARRAGRPAERSAAAGCGEGRGERGCEPRAGGKSRRRGRRESRGAERGRGQACPPPRAGVCLFSRLVAALARG